jgi:hypothetical protein
MFAVGKWSLFGGGSLAQVWLYSEFWPW